MWKNYLLVSIRNLSRQKMYALINIVGLAIGLAGCLLIAGYVGNELSYEDCHENKDDIVRVACLYHKGKSTTIPFANPMPALAPAIAAECPDVAAVTRFRQVKDVSIEIDQQVFGGNRVFYASPEILRVFTLPLETGDPSTVLTEPSTVLLSQELARKCFGDENPVGRTVRINETECRVTGVLRHIPVNTQIRCDAMVSYSTLEREGVDINRWQNLGHDYTYALLTKGADRGRLQTMVQTLVEKNLKWEGVSVDMRLQSLKRIYLYSELNGELDPRGNLTYVYIFSCIAVLLLVLASINFVNLATARTSRRMKEVAVRKVFGAYRYNLVGQFIVESICLTAASMLLGVALFEIAKPRLEAFIGKELPIGLLSSPFLFLTMVVMVLVVGVLAGSYPAFYMSRHLPAEAMKKDSTRTTSRSGLRRALVVVQFAAAIGLTIIALAIYRQTNFYRVKDMGFRHDDMLVLDLSDSKLTGKCELIRDEIAKANKINGASSFWGAPGSGWLALTSFSNPLRPDLPAVVTPLMWVDENFISTYGMKVVEGRGFSKQFASDRQGAVVLNRAAVTELGLTNPVGQSLVTPDDKQAHPIVGVVEDFHIGSFRDRIGAVILMIEPSRFVHVAAQLPSNDLAGGMAAVTEAWKRVIPNQPIKYQFMNDIIAENYETERKTGSLFIMFSILAAFIGSLGMFGLASFAAERRTKEIGIRKVLGASVPSVVRMLSREFIILVALANLVAWPVAYYGIRWWLQGFVYRIDIGPDMFVYSGVLALIVALLTVSYQAIRAATANPVESLKYE